MSNVVSSIVEVSINKIALGIHVSVDDWIAEGATIASNSAFLDITTFYFTTRVFFEKNAHVPHQF